VLLREDGDFTPKKSYEEAKQAVSSSSNGAMLFTQNSAGLNGRLASTQLISGNRDAVPIIKKDQNVVSSAVAGAAIGSTSGTPGSPLSIIGTLFGGVSGGATAVKSNLSGGANRDYKNPALEALTGQKTPAVSGGSWLADVSKKTQSGGSGGNGGGLFNFSFSPSGSTGDLPFSNPAVNWSPNIVLPFGQTGDMPGSNPYIIMPGGTGTQNGNSGLGLTEMAVIGAVALGGAYLLTRGKR
jgi:hypothetical protein